MTCQPSGPQPARMLIVGEAPGYDEIRLGEPFIGLSGKELTRMLADAGLQRNQCRITNVTMERPPANDINAFFAKKSEVTANHTLLAGRWCSPEITRGLDALRQEVARANPDVIVALGDTALWALTGRSGITKWRGSYLPLTPVYGGPTPVDTVVLPTYHPAAILRQWSWRYIAIADLRRAKECLAKVPQPPAERYRTGGDFDQQHDWLNELELRIMDAPLELSCDIETRAGHIDCIGFAWSASDALCVPLFSLQHPSLWTLEQEAELVRRIRRILSHPNAQIIGQNFLYDAQYIARHWGLAVVPAFDTMIAQGVAWPGLPKALDFLSSMYLPWHQYWKDESQEADDAFDDDRRWHYNCRDCTVTWALLEPMQRTLQVLGVEAPYRIEMDLFRPLLMMMMRGVLIDTKSRGRLMSELMSIQSEYEDYFSSFIAPLIEGVKLAKSKDAKPWWRSPTQQQRLFYELLGQAPVRNRKTGNTSVDDQALDKIAKREPLLLPLCRALQRYRSTGVFLNTFVQAPLDWDSRIRSSYNPVGTETLRLSSRADAFGKGTNLQNIPKGE